MPDRDRLVLSKGHASSALYAAQAAHGYFDRAELKKFRSIDGILQGHPSMTKTPGVDMSSGSLGQGLSCANGMALAGRVDHKTYRVYCICGDGEMQEGQIWEALMTAAHYKLDQLTLFVDRNGLQIDGPTAQVMNIEPPGKEAGCFRVVCADDRRPRRRRHRPGDQACQSRIRETLRHHSQYGERQGCFLYGKYRRLAWNTAGFKTK